MPNSPKLVIVIALVVFTQLLIMDITKYYNVMIDIIAGDKKMRYLDLLLFIILSPSTLFFYVELKILNNENLVKRMHCCKLYKWLKTEIKTKK